ncbi:kinase [Thalictrum thalictroides]|uniref:non-specific serine/threonine protein kinase n=1 Tax=Thalictrum thalictroides TaxID=46969 RepID=A0A7J6WBJ5_THATH|nr:kinase [Thalictrum thalictroides]
MPGRRSNYSLLSQFPEEQQQQQQQQSQQQQQQSKFIGAQFYESLSGDKSKGKTERNFDWDGVGVGDHRRISNLVPSIGLQRQSSGSSFGESSLSGEYFVPTLSMTAQNDQEVFGYLHEDLHKSGGGELMLKGREAAGSSSSKTWAQQTEESYQLQLALALRLSNDATCADDPNFLDPVPDESARRSSSASPEVLSHRFWVNGCLSYFDRIPDGFYLINGMDPYVWTMCTDLQENGRVPSLESLRAMYPGDNLSVEVVLVDKHGDSSLKELQNRIISLSQNCISTNEVVDHLAKLVSNHMGGAAGTSELELVSRWKDCSEVLKDCLDSVVLPIGSLSVGLCRHRALLFKVLADMIDLPCRVVKGCKYCWKNDASSCLVRFGLDREYLVDLIEKPGCLYEPDSILNGPSSILISSPLRLPKLKPVEITENSRLLAKQYFMDFQSLNLVFGDAASGTVDALEHKTDTLFQLFDRVNADMNNPMPASGSTSSYVILPQRIGQSEEHGRLPHLLTSDEQRVLPSVAMSTARVDTSRDPRYTGASQVVSNRSSTELSLDVEDLDIPWNDLILKERIGAGSFGTVHRADWNGSEVAVKILMEQDFHLVRFKEFLREVALMKRLRHPNIVLFMGAVTQPPNLSIVTEYLSRGSLYRLLHKSGAREILDERRRISMAFDVAKGMNYLHRRNPPIVHRDLKSPNLLVDKKYTVKVCDFGLSRLKANTFLSAKSAAGTPEWMAPEVLRDEPSNEKCDVYSFGVILWELMTLQLPWSNLNQAQVVAAVGFKNKRLEIPASVNPQVAILIEACWANEPWKRPSFSSIMETLKPMIKPPTPHPVHPTLPRLA